MFTDPKVGMMSATIWPSIIRGRAATGGRHGGRQRMIEGQMVADIIPTFGSVNMIGGELDR